MIRLSRKQYNELVLEEEAHLKDGHWLHTVCMIFAEKLNFPLFIVKWESWLNQVDPLIKGTT